MLPQIMPLSWMLILIMIFFSFYCLLLYLNNLTLSFKKDLMNVFYSYNKIIW